MNKPLVREEDNVSEPHYRNGHDNRHDKVTEALEWPRSEDGRAVSEEVYWAEYYNHLDFNYEWNNGILEEKPMADVQNATLYRWFLLLLEFYLRVQPIAQLVNLEIGFRLELPDKTTIRKPDLFVVRNDNPTPLQATDATFRGIGDLCVESISDSKKSEVERDTVAKKAEYAGAGVKEYFILDAERRYTAFYRRTANNDYAPVPIGADGIVRSEVLPGFQFRVADLYRLPSWLEMTADPVYQQFVLPEYQQMQALAEQERSRAERLAAKLRELGITEDNL
jgi:Uma2 family endonuclease